MSKSPVHGGHRVDRGSAICIAVIVSIGQGGLSSIEGGPLPHRVS